MPPSTTAETCAEPTAGSSLLVVLPKMSKLNCFVCILSFFACILSFFACILSFFACILSFFWAQCCTKTLRNNGSF